MGTAAVVLRDLSAHLSLWGGDLGAILSAGGSGIRAVCPLAGGYGIRAARPRCRLLSGGFQWGAQGEVAGGLVVLAEGAKGGLLLGAQLLRVGASGAEAAA